MELPTSNRKKVIDISVTGLVAKNDPFSVFLEGHISETARPTSRKIFTEFFLGIISKCAKFHRNRSRVSQI